jgi:(p)ppGpp synthase/HD superfamily hydrolase
MVEIYHEDPLIQKAYKYALVAHGDQKRKFTGKPYMTHPVKVATLLQFFFDDPKVIAAALLHDVLEDTSTTYVNLLVAFNKELADLVSEVTDVSGRWDGNRKARKEIDNHHLSKGSPEAQSIKLADIFHNLHDVVRNNPSFAYQYFSEKKETFDVLVNGHPLLRLMVKALLDDFFENSAGKLVPAP